MDELPQGSTLVKVSVQTTDGDGCQVKLKKDLQDWNMELNSIPLSCAGKRLQIELKFQDNNGVIDEYIFETPDPICKKEDEENEEKKSFALACAIGIGTTIVAIGVVIAVIIRLRKLRKLRNRPAEQNPEAGEQMEAMNEAGGHVEN